jgi:hypothetical protein
MLYEKKIPLLLTVLFLIFSNGVLAQEEKSDEEVKGSGVRTSTSFTLQLSSEPAFKILVTQYFVFPFLRGSGSLTERNNLRAALTFDFTPISFNGTCEFTLTPIAFLEVNGGAKAGSGWNINLFGGDIYGIGINAPGETDAASGFRKSKVIGGAFDGLIWSAWGGTAFQFDLAALFPGDWNHILFRTYHEARYSAYTAAKKGESWFFESDYGENMNGWMYNAAYILGYQMPKSPVLNLLGVMAELRKNFYNVPNGDIWGDSLGYWILSGFMNLRITRSFSAFFAVQMHTRRNHGSSDLENEDFLFYQDLPIDRDHGERKLIFYRAAAILNYRLR